MGVEIKPFVYINQFKPASTTSWMLGNTGDWLMLRIDASFEVREEFTEQYTITLSDPNKITLNSGENWADKGFYVGLDFFLKLDINWNGTPGVSIVPLRVISLLGNVMEVNRQGTPQLTWGLTNFPQVIPSVINSEGKVQDVSMWADVQPQGIELDFAHIKNSTTASGVIASHIDGSKTSLVMEDTDSMVALAAAVDFTHQLNFKSGMSLEKATCQYLGSADTRYDYRFELTFMLSSFYDDITNLINDIAPDAVLGEEALTFIASIRGLPVYNNPNVSISNNIKKTVLKGNTGWFDENFNQLPNPFEHTDVVYKNLAGTTIPQLDYTNPTVMTTTISGLNNPLSGMFQYGFIWCSQIEEDYKDNNNPFHKNLKVSTGGQASSMTDVFSQGILSSPFPNVREGYSVDGISGLDASNISFIEDGAGNIDVSITFRPSAGFTAYMDSVGENQRKYALWVSIGDQVPDTNKSDRVSLWLDYRTMDTYVEPIGVFPGLTIDFLNHAQVYTDTPVACGNEMFVEDDILAKIALTVDTAISPTNPIPTGVNVGVLIQRNSDGFQYKLDKSSANLIPYPNPTQYNFNQDRDFKLGAGNDKNWFKVDYAGNAGGTLEDVLVWYGFKIRWEDWLGINPNPPSEFYDNAELQNGKNNDWYHYFSTSGWTLAFFVEIEALLDGIKVTYQNVTPLPIKDYDSNSTISTTITTYQDNAGVKGAAIAASAGVGVILANEYVWVDITYTSTVVVADWASQITVDSNVYATQCVDDLGAGQKVFRQLSSLWNPENDNPMVSIPTYVSGLAKIVWIDNKNIRVETRILASKLIDADRYKISGRIGCK